MGHQAGSTPALLGRTCRLAGHRVQDLSGQIVWPGNCLHYSSLGLSGIAGTLSGIAGTLSGIAGTLSSIAGILLGIAGDLPVCLQELFAVILTGIEDQPGNYSDYVVDSLAVHFVGGFGLYHSFRFQDLKKIQIKTDTIDITKSLNNILHF